jgi:hypothetical protein
LSQEGKGLKCTASFIYRLFWTTITAGYNMSAARLQILHGWHAVPIDKAAAKQTHDAQREASAALRALRSLLPSMRVLKGLLLLVYQQLIEPHRELYDRNVIAVDG